MCMKKYRLYIDETGNSDISSSDNPNHRFLTLTGVSIELGYVESVIFPELEALKNAYFKSHPDDPVVLHRKEMVNQKHPFELLGDEQVRNRFNKNLLELLECWQYTVITVLIDKLEHKQKYSSWQFDPYHYGLMIMIERYVLFLEENEAIGDVMAESRGGKDDRRLKDSFERLIQRGTEYIDSQRFLKSLTSKQLKVKSKLNNIAGLQLADIIAHPSRRDILIEEKLMEDNRTDVFGDEIVKILQKKYYQKNSKIIGYGKKKLP